MLNSNGPAQTAGREILDLSKDCVNCGSPQPDDVQFEQAPKEELLTDEEVKEKVEAGADIHCPYCGTRNQANSEVCTKCGGDLAEGLKRESGRVVGAYKTGPVSMVPCPRCGTENPDTAKQCTQCGSSMEKEEEAARQSPPPKDEKPAKKRNPLVVADYHRFFDCGLRHCSGVNPIIYADGGSNRHCPGCRMAAHSFCGEIDAS